MHFNGIFSMLQGEYTTKELNMAIHRFFRGTRSYPLLETEDGGLSWLGKALVPRIHYVYLPHGTSRGEEEVQNGWSRRSSFFMEKGKQIWVVYPYLYRCQQTEWRWSMNVMGKYISPGEPGSIVETLLLQEDGAVYERYIVTDEEDAEDSSQQFICYEAGGEVTITGVEYYTENLTIPSFLNGKRVAAAYLGYCQQLRHLRSLTVEAGVRRLDLCWGLKSLKKLCLPESVELVKQPRYIHFSDWYASQPEGPVYFQNWYVGTKGKPLSRVLVIREGTVGIAKEADSISWDRIVLPESLTYIGDCAFPSTTVPPKVIYPPNAKQLECAFDSFEAVFGSLWPEEKNVKALREHTHKAVSAQALYALGHGRSDLRPDIHHRWMPLVPRFRYTKDRWVAEFLYSTEAADRLGYYAAIDVASGYLLKKQRMKRYSIPWPCGVWTDSYRTPFYKMGEDYLEFCAKVIQSGQAPEKEILKEMNRWWYLILPIEIKALLQENEG